MARRRRERAQTERVFALAVLAGTVVAAPMWMAGITPGGALLVAIAGPIAAIAAHRAYAPSAPPLRHPIVVAASVGGALVGLQSLPMPIDAVAIWYPEAAESMRAATSLSGATAGWSSISLAPTETRRELTEGLAVVAVLVAAWSASAGGDRIWVVRTAAISIALVAAVSLVHLVLDVRQPFGVLPEPSFNPRFIGPILNQNMLAGVLAAGVPLAIACGLEAERREVRLPWLLLAAGLALMATLAGSRGGLLSLAVGVLVLLVLLQRGRRPAHGRAVLAVAVGLVLVVVATAFAVVGDAMIAETQGTQPKLVIFAQSLDVLASAPWTGVGRGAFSAAFVGLHGGLERPDHPENLVLEWVSELGLPVALVVLGALAWSLVRSMRAARSHAQVGAIAAVISLVVHDMFDFALEMAGIAVLGAAVLGAAVAPSRAERSAARVTDRRLSPVALGGIALAISLPLTPSVLHLSVPVLRDDIVDAIAAREWDRADALLTRAIPAHPTEPTFPLLAAHAALLRDHPDTLRWLNRVMHLAPGWYEPHHLAARWLARRRAIEQAWLEVREVRRIEPGRARTAACVVAGQPGSSAAALRILGEDLELLEMLVGCSGEADAAALDDVLAARGQPASRVRRARAALRAGRAEDALTALSDLPDSESVVLARADALDASGRRDEARALLERWAEAHPRRPVLTRLARAQADTGDAEAMRTTLDDLLAMGDGSTAALADQRLLLAQLEAALGHHALAMRALQDAHAADPRGPALERMLALARREGDEHRARLTQRELCHRDGPSSPHCRGERSGTPAQLPTLP